MAFLAGVLYEDGLEWRGKQEEKSDEFKSIWLFDQDAFIVKYVLFLG